MKEKISQFRESVMSNLFQRKGKGGRPAIIANSKNFTVENLTQTVIPIPWGVEAVWAVLTPRMSQVKVKSRRLLWGHYIQSLTVDKSQLCWIIYLKCTIQGVLNTRRVCTGLFVVIQMILT